MANAMRMDEIAAQLAAVVSADSRLDDNLSETPSVYASVPGIEDPTPALRVYVDWISGRSERLEPQVLSGMTMIQLHHWIWVWIVVYHDTPATASANYGKLLDNLVLILADAVDESGYWIVGTIEGWDNSLSHPNLNEAGAVRYQIGRIVFRVIQEKTV